MLSDEQLERYGRQILLHDFDVAGQERLQQASVLIVGQGGLGNPAALYLAGAGVGRLVLCDGDQVELSNLQRQIAHSETGLGMNKAESAAQRIRQSNSDIVVEVVDQFVDETGLPALLQGIDLVVDGTDNYPVRYALNRACIAAGIPLVSGAAVRAEGQVAVFHPAQGGPCYRCLYPDQGSDTALSCSESGVLSPLVGVIGSLQAMEALKVLAGYGQPLLGQLLVADLSRADFRKLKIAPRPSCPDCSAVQTGR